MNGFVEPSASQHSQEHVLFYEEEEDASTALNQDINQENFMT
jgi:hypothetical protein